MPADPPALKALFLAALDVPPPDRPGWLDRACGPDPDLRRQVDALLAAHHTRHSLLDGVIPPLTDPDGGTAAYPAGGAAAPGGADPVGPGSIVAGRYELVAVIGEGGMGTVWKARQTDPVTRDVALKVVKAGMDTRAVLARFDAERQALARMDHPHIAKVFDAGATAAGQPFFVMELVAGPP